MFIFYLGIYKFDCASISSRKHCENFKIPTFTKPRRTIFKDFYNLRIFLKNLNLENDKYKCEYIKIRENFSFFFVTFVGSKLTRPQALAATPLQLCEMAKIPTESGPG